MKRALRKLVFVEPRSTHLHVYSRVAHSPPRLGAARHHHARQGLRRARLHRGHPGDRHERGPVRRPRGDLGHHLDGAPVVRWPTWCAGGAASVVMGGTHTSFLPEEGLQHADFVVRGEGEFAFQELVDAIQGGDGFDKIQNLSLPHDGRARRHNPERPKIPNLDVNPIPDYHLISGWKPGGVIVASPPRAGARSPAPSARCPACTATPSAPTRSRACWRSCRSTRATCTPSSPTTSSPPTRSA